MQSTSTSTMRDALYHAGCASLWPRFLAEDEMHDVGSAHKAKLMLSCQDCLAVTPVMPRLWVGEMVAGVYV